MMLDIADAVLSVTAVLIVIGMLWPVLATFYVVLRKGRGVHCKWLFLLAGPALVYSVLWVLILIFIAPAFIILQFFAPAAIQLERALPYWEPIYAWVVAYNHLLTAVLCYALTRWWLVMHIWPRWPAIVLALKNKPSVHA